MKILLLATIAGALHALPLSAQFSFHSVGTTLGVPDGSLVGVSDTHWISDPALDGFRVSKVDVTFQFSGGWNGDLFAQLNHNGQFSVLLNRVGVSPGNPLGYGDSGFSLTFSDAAANGDVHQYQATLASGGTHLGGAPLTGLWAPDGRPYGQEMATGPSARVAMLSQFAGTAVNGDWTVVMADLSPGGQGQLLSWGLEISYVPEPAAFAGLTALLLAGWSLWRRRSSSGRAGWPTW
jgi:hypothetical protein